MSIRENLAPGSCDPRTSTVRPRSPHEIPCVLPADFADCCFARRVCHQCIRTRKRRDSRWTRRQDGRGRAREGRWRQTTVAASSRQRDNPDARCGNQMRSGMHNRHRVPEQLPSQPEWRRQLLRHRYWHMLRQCRPGVHCSDKQRCWWHVLTPRRLGCIVSSSV